MKKSNIKLNEGEVVIGKTKAGNLVTADINLDIGYKIHRKSISDHYSIETRNAGGGNYIAICGVNDNEDTDNESVQLCGLYDLELMIKHFKKSYKQLVPNTKIV